MGHAAALRLEHHESVISDIIGCSFPSSGMPWGRLGTRSGKEDFIKNRPAGRSLISVCQRPPVTRADLLDAGDVKTRQAGGGIIDGLRRATEGLKTIAVSDDSRQISASADTAMPGCRQNKLGSGTVNHYPLRNRAAAGPSTILGINRGLRRNTGHRQPQRCTSAPRRYAPVQALPFRTRGGGAEPPPSTVSLPGQTSGSRAIGSNGRIAAVGMIRRVMTNAEFRSLTAG